MSTNKNDLLSKIDRLQLQLNDSRMDTAPLNPTLNLGSGRRPNILGTGGRNRRNLELPFPVPAPNHVDIEMEDKLQQIKLKNGILTINGEAHLTQRKDLTDLGELGNGTSGSVMKMRHNKSKTIIAVKQMRRTANIEETKRIIMDIDVVLKSYDCPYIVQCLGCYITDVDVWIYMELMATCFDKLLKKSKLPVPEEILGKVTVATVKALSYLKDKHDVIHRDVKPSNILIDERGNIKLCDFGISGRLVDSLAKTRSAGCAGYMAPERIDPDPKKPEYDIRADVWSLGITLVELATGSFPYQGCKTDFEVLTRVLESAPPSLPTNTGFSLEFQSFVNKCLTKNYMARPKYKELLEQPFIKMYEQIDVDVPSWFDSIMEESGLQSNLRHSPLPENTKRNTTTNATTTTHIPNYQYNNSNSNIKPVNNFKNSQEMHQLISQPYNTKLTTPSTRSDASATLKPSISNKQHEPHHNSNKLQLLQLHQPNSGGFRKLSSQPPVLSSPPQPQKSPLPAQQSKNSFFNDNRNGFNQHLIKDERDLVSEMNKMYKNSPFMHRKRSEVNEDGSNGDGNASLNQNNHFIYNNLAQTLNRTPIMAKKNATKLREDQVFWNLQHPPDDQHDSGIHQRHNVVPSPHLGRKRFQTTIPVSDTTPPPHHQHNNIRPQGSTSPIVLQRFYHQQSQLRERDHQNTSDRRTQQHDNSYLSHIPKYQHQYSASPPLPSVGLMQQTNSSSYTTLQQHQQPQSLPLDTNSSSNTVPTTLSNSTSKITCDQQPNYITSNIPIYNHNHPPNSPKQFHNSNTKWLSSSPSASPQNSYVDRDGLQHNNVYSNNIYGRSQSLQQQQHHHLYSKQQAADRLQESTNDRDRDDPGWFNSIAGVVKRRFASYVKLHISANSENGNNGKEVNKDNNRDCLADKRQQMAAAAAAATTSIISSSPSQLPVLTKIQPPNPHVLSGIDRRHRSPDPPPRYNRGQSPLLLRRNLLEYGQSNTGSPVLPRRYTSSPPLPPPRRGSESVPGSPQHFRTRIHYTPEPQRRIYRSIDQ